MNIEVVQARRILNKLEQYRLAEKIGGYWKVPSMSLKYMDQIAEKLGVAGASALQHVEHQRQRKDNQDSQGRKNGNWPGRRLNKADRDSKSLQALAR